MGCVVGIVQLNVPAVALTLLLMVERNTPFRSSSIFTVPVSATGVQVTAWTPVLHTSPPFGEVTVIEVGGPVKPAPTAWSAEAIFSVQSAAVPKLAQSPVHPSNVLVGPGAAVSTTAALFAKFAAHVPREQASPAGFELTDPWPP